MAALLPMSADHLRTFLESAETDENTDSIEKIKIRRNVLVLDCRSFVAYNDGHIINAANVLCPAILRRRSRGYLPLRTVVPNANVVHLLNNGGYYLVVLYDSCSVPQWNSGSSALKEQLSTVEFVAKCLQTEAKLKSVFYLEGGYQNFLQLFPHLCTPPSAIASSPDLSSSSVKSCPLLGRHVSRNTGMSLTSKTFREQHRKFHCDTGPVEILPHLWLGSSRDASKVQLLKELGITSLLNVSRNRPCPELLTLLKSFQYKCIPLRDSSCQVIDYFFEEAFDFIAKAKQSGGKVLVYCRAGISRSATICIAYLMWRKGLRMEEAYEYVKSRRRIVSPNFNFMGQLLLFEKRLFDGSVSCHSKVRNSFDSLTPHSGVLFSASVNRDMEGKSVFDFRNINPSCRDEQQVRSPV